MAFITCHDIRKTFPRAKPPGCGRNGIKGIKAHKTEVEFFFPLPSLPPSLPLLVQHGPRSLNREILALVGRQKERRASQGERER